MERVCARDKAYDRKGEEKSCDGRPGQLAGRNLCFVKREGGLAGKVLAAFEFVA